MNEMISYFNKDIKRINHAIKVYTFAKTIGEIEKVEKEKMVIIQLSAILHDIGIKESEKKYHSSSGKYQEIEGPPIARKILKKYGIEDKILERICYIIGNHHTYDKVDDVDFQVLIEADLMVNIHEDQIQKEIVLRIKNKYYKTESGKNILTSMYLPK
ncbi:MAG: HD domain-containing protein [Eubacteriales bacterium]